MVIKEALTMGRALLSKAQVPDASVDASLLLQAACGVSRGYCLAHPEMVLSDEQVERYEAFLERRAGREPCQYILGSVEFYGLTFAVDSRVLIPRQDTEVLVEESLQVLPEDGAVLDLCTGSGAIAAAIKHMRPDARVTAADLSGEALCVARANCAANACEVALLEGDLFEAVPAGETFDLIVSNPPYISEGEYRELMPEVRDHEPQMALLAGADGLDLYRRLVAKAPAYLKAGGFLLVEIGACEAQAVSSLFAKAGFTEVQVRKDLAGLDRVVKGRIF